MKRNFKSLLSLETVKHAFYVPALIFKIKNWPVFLMNYAGFKDSKEIYQFRNGTKIKTNEAIDTSTIAVIYVKKDYGIVKDNSTIIDIGTNIGTYSIYAATTAKNTKVYSYEPMQNTFQMLKDNISINQLKNIKPFNLAIASKKEKRKLFLVVASPFNSMYSQGQDRDFVEVNCVPLKDVFDSNKIRSCDILKMDCEGAEYEIIYSLPKKYFDRIKEIRMEYHNIKSDKKSYNIDSLSDFLRKEGYERTFFRKDSDYSGIAWFRKNS